MCQCLAEQPGLRWPAGTGKTLVARALAAQASQAGKKVTFFMRKGLAPTPSTLASAAVICITKGNAAGWRFGLNGRPVQTHIAPLLDCPPMGRPSTLSKLVVYHIVYGLDHGNQIRVSRQGADILSKWVGEAERMLRLLFAEAERCQPSIIFFDEIDGLAPVRPCCHCFLYVTCLVRWLMFVHWIEAALGRALVPCRCAPHMPAY